MTADTQQMIETLGQQARQAARALAWAPTRLKNQALLAMADALQAARDLLRDENRKDLSQAEARGLAPAMVDRLRLTDPRIDDMAAGLRQIATLPDPVGAIEDTRRLENTLTVGQMRVPLGVIGIIYESRPNVTADAAGLCLKSGNAVILRGGSEAWHSNRAIVAQLTAALEGSGLPRHAVQFIETTDREAVGALLRAQRHVDVIIPRGGKGLIQRVMEDATIPVIKHLDGICHTYVDRHADLDMALTLTLNGKMQRTGVCNATETLLVHRAVAEAFLPRVAHALVAAGCELRGCAVTQQQIQCLPATDADWDTEYLAAILSIRVVDSLDAAIDHIETHSSRHTETIVTRDHERAMRFLREVDSSAVMVNASTRFNDGFQFGLGAEMGISTDKLHVRGPVGLEGLTTRKWVVFGSGQVRS
ncbi:MAG: glutamate-5-semialdehyde dehydrogenase [Magnetococcus sp. WYHC-3]